MGKKQPSEQTPVYAVVHASLRTQIFTGQYRPGDLLPSESHLCQEFGASRETVRRGLQQLENEGLIFSRPKIGYFVSQPNHNDMVLSLSEELEGTELQYRDIHGILPDERLQELLDIPANRKVIEFSQISRDGEAAGGIRCQIRTLCPGVPFRGKRDPIRRAAGSDLCQAVLVFGVFPDHGHGRRGGGRTGAGAGVPGGNAAAADRADLSPAGRQPGGGTAPLQPRPTGQAHGNIGSQTIK